ncbi:hypothetical protein EDC14_1001188 [Hydrogenispora ethanolica]|jgi:hypothetical protein|uniref:Uncharacterized protein n=1 Tax=Hydrogenispora ethanolica TaxID=1082276 RepID=A0A4R1SBH5_HYDET|nr:hypothetical protein EDC14_1001188 [Hydrogenispora ethanolica]
MVPAALSILFPVPFILIYRPVPGRGRVLLPVCDVLEAGYAILPGKPCLAVSGMVLGPARIFFILVRIKAILVRDASILQGIPRSL